MSKWRRDHSVYTSSFLRFHSLKTPTPAALVQVTQQQFPDEVNGSRIIGHLHGVTALRPQLRLVGTREGRYDVDALAKCVQIHREELRA